MKYQELLYALKRLNEGELYTPVAIEGLSTYRSMLQEAEELRCNLIRARDAELMREKKNQNAVAAVVHDLKTPLTVIAGYVECLEDGLDDKDYIALIFAKCTEMNNLILTLLDAAKEERAEQVEQREKVSARQFFTQELNKYALLAQKAGLTLKVGKIPDVSLRIARGQVARVVQNIVSNAIKYTKQGDIRITFKRRGIFLSIKISDSGNGIAKENLPFVFDKFFMEDASRTSNKNSGLGLYIAKEIVVAHGGKITVANRKKGGCAFVFSLPLDAEVSVKKRFFATAFDHMPYVFRLLLIITLAPFVGSAYRFSKFHKYRNYSTLLGAIILLPLFVFTWILDIVSVAVSGKITLLAD